MEASEHIGKLHEEIRRGGIAKDTPLAEHQKRSGTIKECNAVEAVVVARGIENTVRLGCVVVDRERPCTRELIIVATCVTLVDRQLGKAVVGEVGQAKRCFSARYCGVALGKVVSHKGRDAQSRVDPAVMWHCLEKRAGKGRTEVADAIARVGRVEASSGTTAEIRGIGVRKTTNAIETGVSRRSDQGQGPTTPVRWQRGRVRGPERAH